MEQRISNLSLDNENKLKEGHGGLLRKKKVLCVCEKKRKRKSVRKNFEFLCVKKCSWKRCVQESNMERSRV